MSQTWGPKLIAAMCAGSKGNSAFEQLDAQGPSMLTALQREWAAANASSGSAQEARAPLHASTSWLDTDSPCPCSGQRAFNDAQVTTSLS